MKLIDIECGIANGHLSAAQVFTQMKQHIPTEADLIAQNLALLCKIEDEYKREYMGQQQGVLYRSIIADEKKRIGESSE